MLCQILHSGRDTQDVCFLVVYSFFSSPQHVQTLGLGCCGVFVVGQLVPVVFTPYDASKSGLSTPSSLGDLNRNLILKQASRLDAFSGYPFRT